MKKKEKKESIILIFIKKKINKENSYFISLLFQNGKH